jgi:adenosylcobinamide-phosphate synthase
MLLMDAKLLFGGLLLALALDACFGDPRRLWGRVPHPVVLMGRAIARLEARRLDLATPAIVQVRRGRNASLLVIGASMLFALAVQELCIRLPLGWLLLGLTMSTLIAARGLYDHVAAVAAGLEQGLEGGRQAVAHIVGRDPASLDAHGVARAAIESTAENFADGVVAPLLWGVVLGLPGMAAYKAINTLDSMIGHRSPRYRYFGRFAARLDDVANWLPARLSALLILAAALCLPGTTPAAGWRAMSRDAPRHRSPNAGWPEAAMAGALGLSLAGPRRYAGNLVDDAWMGAGRAAATPADVCRALRVLVIACILVSILLGSTLLIAAKAGFEGDAALSTTLGPSATRRGGC